MAEVDGESDEGEEEEGGVEAEISVSISKSRVHACRHSECTNKIGREDPSLPLPLTL